MANRRKPRITYGKMFRTKSGRLGRYKYRNGKRVGFVDQYDLPNQRWQNRKKRKGSY